MFKLSRTLFMAAAIGFMAFPLSAQASRTWVSGVGDDANPGSRTAPCKTFAGTISKTAAGGEINVIDPGGFGAVTITKSITIDGTNTLAGIAASNTNGVIVNAGANDVVTLRGLDINGFGTGINGIRFLAGKHLILDRCHIYGFTTGVSVELATAGRVTIQDCIINNISGVGLELNPTAAGQTMVNVDRAQILGCGSHAIHVSKCTVSVRDSVLDHNLGYGVSTSGTCFISLDNTDISMNHVGVRNGAGVIRLSNCLIQGNDTGLLPAGAVINSYGNNRIDGNGSGNTGVTAIPQQ